MLHLESNSYSISSWEQLLQYIIMRATDTGYHHESNRYRISFMRETPTVQYIIYERKSYSTGTSPTRETPTVHYPWESYRIIHERATVHHPWLQYIHHPYHPLRLPTALNPHQPWDKQLPTVGTQSKLYVCNKCNPYNSLRAPTETVGRYTEQIMCLHWSNDT